jgi:hypothetical protein
MGFDFGAQGNKARVATNSQALLLSQVGHLQGMLTCVVPSDDVRWPANLLVHGIMETRQSTRSTIRRKKRTKSTTMSSSMVFDFTVRRKQATDGAGKTLRVYKNT